LPEVINDNRNAQDIIDSRCQERSGGFHNLDVSDRFPAFTRRISHHEYPREFKPVGITKYDGKQDPEQWLQCYSTAIKVSGGSNTTKAVYFPMALELVPLT
jgi:hypothetical protein